MSQEIKNPKVIHIDEKPYSDPINSPNSSEQYQKDYIFHCTIKQLDKLLKNKLISEDEYKQMEQEIIREMKPYLYELYPL